MQETDPHEGRDHVICQGGKGELLEITPTQVSPYWAQVTTKIKP